MAEMAPEDGELRSPDDGELRRFFVGLAEGLTAAGESVDRVQAIMQEVAAAYGAPETNFAVLPTMIMVQTGEATDTRVAISSRVRSSLRFDQIAELSKLLRRARDGTVDPVEGIDELNAIGESTPRFGWPLRVFGHGVLTLGLALMLFPSWQGAAIAFALGLLVGLLKLLRSPTLALIFPVVAAFISSLVVFLLADALGISDPLRVLIAPLVTFLPGGLLTTGTVELAAGQMVAGTARLVTGFVQLALLAFGILAAGTLVGIDGYSYMSSDSERLYLWWVPLVGLVLFAAGNHLHFSSPPRTFSWVLLVLVVAYGGQLLGGVVFGADLSGFFGALLMTPLVLWIDSLRRGVPSQLTFLPAFWILVPGSAGLIGLTEVFGADANDQDLSSALTTVIAIALGVLIGTAAYRSIRYGAQEIGNFHIDLPGVVAPLKPGTPGSWKRVFRRGQ
ncbi:threonine/serine exporter family protein [Leifsonia sp. YIM 134122]|uniref:Threonine/serine exporter family protein n=1 Tax=Leifsonia stereocauli TaxID=3134136 RepID=A0ABU9W3V9_9MICO